MKIQAFPSFCFAVLLAPAAVHAELRLPAIIGDHMVLQQKQPNPIWGWDEPGTPVTVRFAGQSKSAKADAQGKWSVTLDPMAANSQPDQLEVATPSQKIAVSDVLVGEVWMCSGQSNMGFTLSGDWNGDLEALAGHHLPHLRLIRVPIKGTQELQTDFTGAWTDCSADHAKRFSALGYLFGRYVQQVLQVPVGLIDNSWGGSTAEAWVRRSTLDSSPLVQWLAEQNRKNEGYFRDPKSEEDHKIAMEKHARALAQAKVTGKAAPRAPQSPQDWLRGNKRVGNIFAGMVHPTLGYGIKGVIWYQGEANTSRAWEYRDLFPLLIQEWRREWKQGDFPFYWVQLADFKKESAEPEESDWAELREAQTRTLALPNTGQAVIIDLGEGKDIHPRNKHDVAARLVRWALAKDYGIKVAYRSPEFKSMEVQGSKVQLNFECFGSQLRIFDIEEARGFAVCGEDRVWHWAKGALVGPQTIELSCEAVPKPRAVRYAWANNPVCNVTNSEGLPLTPFRTDDFELTTQPKPAEAPNR
jgi:sialate O-acetylesterase